MLTHVALIACGLLPAVAACHKITDVEGEFALAFDGSPSCASVPLPTTNFPDALTVETWIRADSDVSYGAHPLIIWSGALALWEDADGTGWFSEEDPEGDGATGPTNWMDGDLHHVAGTWDGESGVATLYMDGERVGLATQAVLGTNANDRIQIGCWGTKAYHEGLIDEVRISDTLRYDGDYDVPTGPFALDNQTWHLWHLDEGQGDYGIDENKRGDVELTDVEWVEFTLANEIP